MLCGFNEDLVRQVTQIRICRLLTQIHTALLHLDHNAEVTARDPSRAEMTKHISQAE